MCQRCGNSNSINYGRYGGQGIGICKEWREDFGAFWAWAISQGYDDDIERQKKRKDRLTIDRINPSGNYCPENCRWATYREQVNNRKNNVRFEYKGESKTLGEICEMVGINYSCLYRRVVIQNWPLEKALAS